MGRKRHEVRDGTKRCPKCGEWKNVEEEFHRHKGMWDGHTPWCKRCCVAYQKDRQARGVTWVKIHPVENAERLRAYRASHPDYRAKESERLRAYRAAHPEYRAKELERTRRRRVAQRQQGGIK